MINWKKSGGPYFNIAGYTFSLLNLTDAHLNVTGKSVETDKWSHVHIVTPKREQVIRSKGKGKKASSTVVYTGQDRDVLEVGSMTGMKTKMYDSNDKKNIVRIFKKYSKDNYIHKKDVEKLYNELEKSLSNSVKESIDFLLGE